MVKVGARRIIRLSEMDESLTIRGDRLNGDATLCGMCLHDTRDDTWSHGGISNTTNAKANALTII